VQLDQLRAAVRQVGYLAGVGAFDCESALASKPEKRAGLFEPNGELSGVGREFVAATVMEALRDWGGNK